MFGLDLLKPLIENSSNTFGTGEMSQEQARKDARYDYLENERGGIQARVEGAKAAGLHPLAALGFQAGAPSQVVGGEGTNLSGVSFGNTNRAPVVDTEIRDAQLRLTNAQAANNEAEARFHDSQYRRATQPGNPPVYPTDPENLIPGQGSSSSPIVIKPNEITSSINGQEVGIQPTTSAGRLPNGQKVYGASDWMLKQTEDMEIARAALFAYLNRDAIIDPIVKRPVDAMGRAIEWGMKHGILPSGKNSHRDARDAARFQKHEDTRELIRLINRSRARDRQR